MRDLLPKGTKEILHALKTHSQRFKELTTITVGSKPINRRTLIHRLKMLEFERCVERVLRLAHPTTVDYCLTERGRRLIETLEGRT